MTEWTAAQEYERAWWSDCANTFTEETKQLTYAYKMGLTAYSDGGHWPIYDLGGARVIDIGGGPVSMLLKCANLGPASTVIDPCPYPDWVDGRYRAAGIDWWAGRGEDVEQGTFDEAWIYNCLQHTEDPAAIVANARRVAPLIRIFEWIDMEPCDGHPQMLTEAGLNNWLGGVGTTEWLNENGCIGRSYYGVFKL